MNTNVPDTYLDQQGNKCSNNKIAVKAAFYSENERPQGCPDVSVAPSPRLRAV